MLILEKIRTKLSLILQKFENTTEILSYDRELMSRYNIWPIDRFDIKFMLFIILAMLIPSVSIIGLK